jgi:endonuclease/exonuclease/phosphatase family metal-dependent hydrolase
MRVIVARRPAPGELMFMRMLIAAGLVLAALPALAQEFRMITLMSWNVENLFDTADDQNNPFDDTYLPRAVKQARPGHEEHCRTYFDILAFRRECIEIDWTEDKLRRKLQGIVAVIRAIRPQPDIIILPELENPAILIRLNAEFLSGMGYGTEVELDSTVTDLDRGIDVGILSRLPLAGTPRAHKVDFGNDAELCRATRDITEAPLQLPDGKTLHLFAVHFPSGNNPIKCREHGMRTLNAISSALPADAVAVAGGDFNFPCSEAQGDLFARMLREALERPARSAPRLRRARLEQVPQHAARRARLVHLVVPRFLSRL